ncbi:uncharacterized protein PAC_13084 [Phialocephala subalpina]|uniref:C2H2-type domain-containing protein n=1 Tax=Phialocephala subalpina TaxID=576137 RepID=A0A1L7XDV1_9HELO|nr:uncharacterized protein PAC_13084 [Phialocephala subalpina]
MAGVNTLASTVYTERRIYPTSRTEPQPEVIDLTADDPPQPRSEPREVIDLTADRPPRRRRRETVVPMVVKLPQNLVSPSPADNTQYHDTGRVDVQEQNRLQDLARAALMTLEQQEQIRTQMPATQPPATPVTRVQRPPQSYDPGPQASLANRDLVALPRRSSLIFPVARNATVSSRYQSRGYPQPWWQSALASRPRHNLALVASYTHNEYIAAGEQNFRKCPHCNSWLLTGQDLIDHVSEQHWLLLIEHDFFPSVFSEQLHCQPSLMELARAEQGNRAREEGFPARQPQTADPQVRQRQKDLEALSQVEQEYRARQEGLTAHPPRTAPWTSNQQPQPAPYQPQYSQQYQIPVALIWGHQSCAPPPPPPDQRQQQRQGPIYDPRLAEAPLLGDPDRVAIPGGWERYKSSHQGNPFQAPMGAGQAQASGPAPQFRQCPYCPAYFDTSQDMMYHIGAQH